MKTLFRLTLYVLSALICYSPAQSLDFGVNPMKAGRVSLTNNTFYEINTLGVANFSPELRQPVQLVYNSGVKKSGIFGYAWQSPQLESSAIPKKNGIVWTTPWGETIEFISRENLNAEEKKIFADEAKGSNKYFAPYSQWEANTVVRKDRRGSNGNWTFTGKGEYKGWTFSYQNSSLTKAISPRGDTIDYIYSNGILTSVRQNGTDFITLTYNDEENVTSITINGVNYTLAYAETDLKVLPSTLKNPAYSLNNVYVLASVQRGGLNPVNYQYDETGYLTSIAQGNSKEELSVQVETLDQKLRNLKASAKQTELKDGKKKKITHNKIVSGRLLSDRNFTYRYPSRSAGKVDLINKAGQQASFSCNPETGIYTQTDFSGKKRTSYYYRRYDVAYMGKLRQVVDERGRTVSSYRYDKSTGKPLRLTDMAGNDINCTYDAEGNMTGVSKRGADDPAESPLLKYEYNKEGDPERIALLDQSGNQTRVTRVKYNDSRRPVSISNGQQTDLIKYNADGYVSGSTNTYGQSASIQYDRYNRPVAVEGYNGITTRYTYDANGHLTRRDVTDGETTLTSATRAYDANGRPEAWSDGKTLRKVERDDEGRVIREHEADGSVVSYSYDNIGNLSKVIDQNGNPIGFEWNKYGLARHRTAENQLTEYKYDETGMLAEIMSRFASSGKPDRHRKLKRDDLDRIIEIDYGQGQSEQYEYDTWGRKIAAIRSDGQTARYTYDHFGRLSETVEGDITRRYQYNQWGQRVGMSVTGKDGVSIEEKREYDKTGRLTAISQNGPPHRQKNV